MKRINDDCWSVDQDDFNARTLQELLENNVNLQAGQVVFVGTAITPAAEQLCDADDIIEMIGERAHDIGGEYAEDFPDVSKEAKAELTAMLANWIAKHCPPTFYTVGSIKPYTLLENDFARSQLEAPL